MGEAILCLLRVDFRLLFFLLLLAWNLYTSDCCMILHGYVCFIWCWWCLEAFPSFFDVWLCWDNILCYWIISLCDFSNIVNLVILGWNFYMFKLTYNLLVYKFLWFFVKFWYFSKFMKELPSFETYDEFLEPLKLFIFINILNLWILTRYLDSMFITLENMTWNFFGIFRIFLLF